MSPNSGRAITSSAIIAEEAIGADVATTAAGEAVATEIAASEASATVVAEGTGAAATEGAVEAVAPEVIEAVAANRTFWQSAQAFGKWVAKEAVELSSLEAGARAFEAALDTIAKKKDDKDAERLANAMPNINEALKKANDCVSDWNLWMSRHFDTRAQYGVVQVDGHKFSLLEVFQAQISTVSLCLTQKVYPAMGVASQSMTLNTVKLLVSSLQEYCQKLKVISIRIKDKEQKMVAAGLNDHV
ncbi:hypothetical protein FOPG_15586 [Fusarium oxysporum f. sp. conglutinans race 2 54008]|uniref:Uncharacterized protein n=3 Tax=Fusarium oxysporum f. sp. conglutinans TaxID=100902 RepID=A0A8H6GYS5_FUSOX|nr:hypothetical protein FOXB_08207 [Fusarium oxysporum f. sp. conglutinans Fo5176]EXL68362.1 hypothetical protein FOPG_15586 [Fusarium oxysporum f. sp. conglutinans race 2 54008]KAF6526146.1 hypothetical protein HZS61_009190 [Fusarium oxysporum f. sp. conglutinans]KAG6981736.1 hypothetical protein FocnCong_v009264 [Fusarium oxysporum f. sp. conglutinans]KAI8414382.1 hypothetical protein FOFC_03992 [Fusarium oxysporum]